MEEELVVHKQVRVTSPSVYFLDSIAEKRHAAARHLDTQTNVIVGVSMAVSLFSLTRILEGESRVSFLILAAFSALAALLGLFAIHPPWFMRKRGQIESLMHSKHVAAFPHSDGYHKELKEVLEDEQKIVEQYAREIYNVSKYYYRPKRKLFHWARDMLLLGVVISIIAFVIQAIIEGGL